MSTVRKHLQKRGSIEAFKFAVYLTIPIIATVYYADPEFMHQYIIKSPLIVYPKSEGSDRNALQTMFQEELKAYRREPGRPSDRE